MSEGIINGLLSCIRKRPYK